MGDGEIAEHGTSWIGWMKKFMMRNEFAVPGVDVRSSPRHCQPVWKSKSIQCCCFAQKNTLEMLLYLLFDRNSNNNMGEDVTRNFLKILHCDDDDDGGKRMTKTTTQLRHKKWVFRMWIFFLFLFLLFDEHTKFPSPSLLDNFFPKGTFTFFFFFAALF